MSQRIRKYNFPNHLNGMYVSAFAVCVSLIVPKSIIQSHCSEEYPIVFCIENEVRQKPTPYNFHEMCFKKAFLTYSRIVMSKMMLSWTFTVFLFAISL